MNKKVFLIINQTALPGERSLTRTMTLYSMLKEKGDDVTIITSAFNHYDKKIRNKESFFKEYPDWKVVFIDEPGYTKNVSVKRIYSQCVFALNLRKWFKGSADHCDVVFMTVPTYEGAAFVGKICNTRHIPYIVNVEDIWPEAMSLFIKPRFLYELLTFPLKRTADKVYKQANGFTAVSQEYLERAQKSNTKAKKHAVVYLGASLELFDKGAVQYAKIVQKQKQEFWIAYIGTLGESYDIRTFIDAVTYLNRNGYPDIKAKILGRGPAELKLRQYAEQNKTGIEFVGFLPYEKMAGYLVNCDLMINAIKKSASQSVVNKVSDYFASGKPVLNGCVQKEMRALIDDYQTGINYEPENEESLINAIVKLYQAPEQCAQLGNNGRKLAEELFDRKNSYKQFIEMIDTIEA